MKRTLALLLTLLMLVTLLPTMAFADGDAAEIVGGASFTTVQAAIDNAQKGDTVKMLADSTEHVYIGDYKEITLDLNGYVLKASSDQYNAAIEVNTGTLTIVDSRPEAEHYFEYRSGSAWKWIEAPSAEQKAAAVTLDAITDTTTVVKLPGGCITGANATNYGGGINNYYGTLTLRGGNIVGNQTEGFGGGIYNKGDEDLGEATLTLSGGSIIGNAASNGGGIHSESYNGETTIENIVISYNSAVTMGGGVRNWGTMTVSGTAEIKNNSAKLGGGIYNDNILNVSGSADISNNTAHSGGGIYNNCTMTLKNCTVTKNTAQIGGGIYNYINWFSEPPSPGTLVIDSCTVSENKAKEDGGGIYNYAATLTVSGSSLISNNETTNNNGGGIYNYSDSESGDSTVNICDSTVIGNNTAFFYGGGVYNYSSGHFKSMLNVSGTAAISNNSGYKGGGVYIEGENSEMNLSGTAKISNNTALSGGGVYNDQGTLNLSGSSLIGNNEAANEYGGVADYGILTVSGAPKVTGNTANGKASNVYLRYTRVVTVGTPETGMSVGVTTKYAPEVDWAQDVTGINSADYKKYFTSDSILYKVVDSESEGDHVVQLVVCEPEITVGEQNGSPTSGTAASATYSVTFTGFEPENHTVVWKDGSAPAGVTTAFSGDNNNTLTVSATAATPAGVYSFTVTAKNGDEEVESGVLTFTVEETPDEPDEPTNTFMAFLAKILAILPALIYFFSKLDWLI